MKHFLLSLISIFSFSVLSAQTITFDPDVVFESGTTEDFNIDAKFETANSSSEQVSFLWQIERIDVPEEWKFTICDANLCYAPGTESCPPSEPNIFDPGFSTNATKVTLQPNGVMYDGMINFKVFDLNDNTIELGNIEINFSVTGSTSTFDVKEDKINVFPNPTSDYFQIESDNDYSKVVLYNIIGKEMQSYSYEVGKTYDVKSLHSGMYLVRLFDESGKANQVLRLTKK